MAHTYISSLFHCVFSTKGRCGLIPPARQPDLFSYLGGIARNNGFKALAVGGTDNHVHVLLSIPATIPLAKAVQLLKGGSSKWMHDSGANNFAWQE
jgi:REP element-mobilizing transposase RayT